MKLTGDRRTTRRNLLRAAAGLSVLGLGAREARAALDGRDGATLSGAVDANFDQRKDLRIRRVRDPSDETPRRGQVLHATSDGTATRDYAITLAVTDDEDLTLGDLTAADDGFAYDWYVGPEETGHAPDEAWLVLRAAAMDADEVRAVFRTEDFETSFDVWTTRTVSPEIEGTYPEDGLGQQWKEYQFDELGSVRIADDLVDEFGADASVLAAGVGRGTPQTGATVADTYYDQLVLDGGERSLEATEERGNGAD